jgi:hypothetical protein
VRTEGVDDLVGAGDAVQAIPAGDVYILASHRGGVAVRLLAHWNLLHEVQRVDVIDTERVRPVGELVALLVIGDTVGTEGLEMARECGVL